MVDVEIVRISVRSLIRVRLFSCHDCPSHGLRETNSRGRLSCTVARPLDLQSNFTLCLFQSILRQVRGETSQALIKPVVTISIKEVKHRGFQPQTFLTQLIVIGCAFVIFHSHKPTTSN